MCMAMIGFMLPPPTLHRRKYLYHQAPSEEVTHQFYKHLCTEIIRDIDVSSQCMLSCVRKGEREGKRWE